MRNECQKLIEPRARLPTRPVLQDRWCRTPPEWREDVLDPVRSASDWFRTAHNARSSVIFRRRSAPAPATSTDGNETPERAIWRAAQWGTQDLFRGSSVRRSRVVVVLLRPTSSE